MELLLNLTWLLLALPAYYLWRNSGCIHAQRRMSSAQCILALTCVLVVLFPVVSATDDLHISQAVMEESPGSKRSVCHRGNDRPAGSRWNAQPSIATVAFLAAVAAQSWFEVPAVRFVIPAVAPITPSGRGPPSPVLS